MLTTGLNLCQGNCSRRSLNATELPAGAQHIAATTAAEVYVHMALAQSVLEDFDRRIRRASIGAAGKWIEGNEVHFAPKPAEQLNQTRGIVDMIIDIRKQDIFEGQTITL